ncbi:MAG: MlaD family protein [Deltaproteobacteria bacterium]|nr:MlaD family protein [Deltaproteobacteria bacterium]
MKRSRLDLLVGLFVLSALALLMWSTMQVGALPGLFAKEGRMFLARFDNVGGLDLETDVLVAGVPVGKVAKIELEGHDARVTLRIEDPQLRIPIDSVVAIRSRGMLGERVLEILPGDSEQRLVPGGAFTRTQAAADMDLLIERATQVAGDIQEVSATFRNVLGGPDGEEALQEVLSNIRSVSWDLRRVVETNEAGIERIVKNLDAFSSDVAGLTRNNREGIDELVQGLRTASRKLNRALDSLANLSGKVERGEGTVGKLLTDDALYQELDATLTDARATLREVRRAAEEAQEQIPATILTTIFGSLF